MFQLTMASNQSKQHSRCLTMKACVAKEIIEAIDDENNSTTFKIIEADLMTEYRNFKAVLQAVRWTFEYEKLNGSVGEPKTLLEFCIHLSKEIDDHLCHA